MIPILLKHDPASILGHASVSHAAKLTLIFNKNAHVTVEMLTAAFGEVKVLAVQPDSAFVAKAEVTRLLVGQ